MKKFLIALILLTFLPLFALAEDPDPIVGRWCVYWDTRPMNEKYNSGKPMMSFLVLDYNLYIFEDNSLYLTQASVKKDGTFKAEWPALDGLWVKSGDNKYTLKFLAKTYTAEFDDQGRLLVYMASTPYPFIRIPSYDYFAENP